MGRVWPDPALRQGVGRAQSATVPKVDRMPTSTAPTIHMRIERTAEISAVLESAEILIDDSTGTERTAGRESP